MFGTTAWGPASGKFRLPATCKSCAFPHSWRRSNNTPYWEKPLQKVRYAIQDEDEN